MTRVVALILLMLGLGSPAAWAQITLPTPVPDVGGVLPPTPELDRAVDLRSLRELRETRIRDLLRTHRRELEADPQGQPIVRSQILALGMSAEALARAEAMGFSVVRRDDLGGDTLAVLRAPAGQSTRRALRRLQEAEPNGVYDFDHLHLESGASVVAPMVFAGQTSAARGPPLRIGLIDTGVADTDAIAAQRAFAGNRVTPADHGGVVASRLLAAAPGARIVVADIYGGAPSGGASSALARALAWMAEENVAVINVSLVGPRNRIIETVIARLVARGYAIVAAVGNDGPAAAPLFPAAYPGVIGVTGVDARGRVLMEAGRGTHVDFAAAGLVSARVRGTSYAAPIVAGLLAAHLGAPDVSARDRALNTLSASARDLGAAGRDPVYGAGLLEAP